MNKLIKVLLIIAGAAFGFGMIFCAIGFAFGGLQLKNTIRSAATVEFVDYDVDFSGDIKSFEFEFGAGNVDIVRGDKFNLKATGVLPNSFDNAGVKDGVLIIKDEGKFNLLNIIEYNGKVTLTLPEDFSAENVIIKTGAGDFRLCDIEANEFELDLGAGNAVLGDITSEGKIRIMSGAGKVECNNLSGKKIDIETGVGDFSASGKITSTDDTYIATGMGNVSINSLDTGRFKVSGGVGNLSFADAVVGDTDIQIGTGEFNFRGILKGNLNYDGGVGNTDIDILGDINEYYVSVDQGTGNISVGDNSMSGAGGSSTYGNSSAQYRIDIDGGVGNVDIDFIKTER